MRSSGDAARLFLCTSISDGEPNFFDYHFPLSVQLTGSIRDLHCDPISIKAKASSRRRQSGNRDLIYSGWSLHAQLD